MTNWLTFTQSPMEMVRSSDHESQFVSYDNSSSSSSTSPYLLDNFYGWSNQKPHGFFKEEAHVATSMTDSTFVVDTQLHVPKLEDFLGDFPSPFLRYSAGNTQAETQEDSSLTKTYDPRHHHHHHHHNNQTGFYSDLTMTGFQTGFSTKSGSDVDVAESYPVLPELGFINGGCVVKGGALSLLGVNINDTNHITNHHYNENREEKTESEKEKLFAIVEKSDCSKKKVADKLGTGQRTSIYRGVTRHRWTGRYEAHLWDNSCKREGQARKGRQVYLGGYDKEDKAARAYDLAALKYWNADATTNFPITNYAKELEEMKHMTKQEFIASLRRRSSGFSRGASIYRGVTRHHQQGRWQARIGRVSGNKDLYLGTFTTEEEAAEAYDIAAIKFRGTNAVTNFEMNRYDVETIMKTALPIGGAAKRLRLSMEASPTEEKPILSFQQLLQLQIQSCPNQSSINFGLCPNSDVQSHMVPFEAASHYHRQQQQNFLHYFPENVASDSTGSNDGSNGQGSMGVLAPNPAEFFLWPNQSY